MTDRSPLMDLWAWRSDANAPAPNLLAPQGPRPEMRPGPTPTLRDRVFDYIYGALGGTPSQRSTASALTDLADFATLGVPTSLDQGVRDVADGKGTFSLAMALVPGAKLGKVAGNAVVQGVDSFGGSLLIKAKGPKPGPGALLPEAEATGASSTLAETPQNLSALTPRNQANLVAEALRERFNIEARVYPGGSAAGASSYIRTPIGDLRFSDHAAGFRAGQAWDFYARPADTVHDALAKYAELKKEVAERAAAFRQDEAARRAARLEMSQPQRDMEAAIRSAKEQFWRDNNLESATKTARDRAWKDFKKNGGRFD